MLCFNGQETPAKNAQKSQEVTPAKEAKKSAKTDEKKKKALGRQQLPRH
jgi:hypothetical protein